MLPLLGTAPPELVPNLPRPSVVEALPAHIDADFLAQVYTSDNNIEVQSAVTHLGKKSFVFVQRLVDSKTGEVKCIGRSIIVTFDLVKNQSVEIWPEWVEAIKKFEGSNLK